MTCLMFGSTRLPCSAFVWMIMVGFGLVPLTAKDSYEMNRMLGTGVNLGNALDAPTEGEWGVVLEERYFILIREAGFDSVRIPVRWSNHAMKMAPYTIEEPFFERVEWAIHQALKNDLAVVVNVHHYLELFESPTQHMERFLALWAQISQRLKDLPETVFFEVLNEPNTNLRADEWNALIPQALEVIRETNPDRMVILGSPNWNNVDWLPHLKLPEEDRRLIVTFHYYSPHEFTHQSTPWSEPKYRDLSGIKWLGTPADKAAVRRDFAIAVDYAKLYDRPLYLGEYGVYDAVDMESRIRWTTFIADEARKLGMSTSYWEFCASFGLYDREENAWRMGLLEAVLP